MSFATRYKNLNTAQKTAVDSIDGPVMVVAGPGTGKTELLSMRAANILKQTDTLPQNILCLTFTESGAAAMRQRLTSIIGPDAYKVAVHTFHSFGTEVMNRNREHFYNGAQFSAASDVVTHEILTSIFDDLDYKNPLASTMNGEYTYLSDTITTISELKRSGLTSDELLNVLSDNERILDGCEASLQTIFTNRITKTTKDELAETALLVANAPERPLPPGITPLQNTLALSISHAFEQAEESDSTKPITAWRNLWMEKNEHDKFVFKDRKRINKLRATAHVYYRYLEEMQKAELFDFDDMVLGVLHAMEVNSDLRYALQEQYLYIMVDEFQDTNLAQARILRTLTGNPANEGAPNIMVVGDDDQAIYSFQGAEISNILQFRGQFETTKLITLTENYRSSATILEQARNVISLGSERLERFLPDLDKTLHANTAPEGTNVALHALQTVPEERDWIASDIAARIASGVSPHTITVIARRHHELVALLPYLAQKDILVNYERRENVLENDVVGHAELLARIVSALALERHDEANAMLPELLSHPAWNIPATELWQLSVAAQKKRVSWLEEMPQHPTFTTFHSWLITQSAASLSLPLETMLDTLIGTHDIDQKTETFRSPIYDHYFSEASFHDHAETYLSLLESLRTIRDALREHTAGIHPKLLDFITFLDTQRSLGLTITAVRGVSPQADDHINLMTAHKSKGQEFDHVYILGSIDSAWGERVRSKSRLISYPENLQIRSAGDSFDERLRLFFVAMTRAKVTLTLSYATSNESGSPLAVASFLAGEHWTPIEHHDEATPQEMVSRTKLSWNERVIAKRDENAEKVILKNILENYKLSATHLNAFLDVTRGGPANFMLHTLLRFPQAMSPNAAYGSAFHNTLQQAHAHYTATKQQRPIEDILHDFETNLENMNLAASDYETYLRRGSDYLQLFLEHEYDTFSTSQKAELNFRTQSSMLENAHLTGSLDLVDINTEEKTITVTDYKTGKPSTSWKGKTDYEKIKLHKYKQQLMFYKLLVEHSRDYSNHQVTDGVIQFVEPTPGGSIVALDIAFDDEDMVEFSKLIQAVWHRITSLDFPSTTEYDQTYKGIMAFEADLIDSHFDK